MLTIDGSHGEGGGQVLRSTLTLAVLTGQPVRIERLRAGRARPGLRPQHLTAVRAAAAISGASLQGDELDSQALTFAPGGPPRAGEYTFDVADAARSGSAGSVGLVLQTVLLPLALSGGESVLTLRGGTHVPWAPSASYLEHVFLPALARMGIHGRMECRRWGFYPAGGGEVRVEIAGRERAPQPADLVERGPLQRAWGIAAVTNLPAHIPQRMASRARNVLAEAGIDAQIEPRRLSGAGPGAGVFLFAEYAGPAAGPAITAGFTGYGRKGLPAESVAEVACAEFIAHHRSGCPVDPHLADQLLLPMALAEPDPGGQDCSRLATSRVSQHLQTNVWAVQQFLATGVIVEGAPGAAGTVVVTRRNA
jgi:RNA 3'-terminal phosphate cyclase (ATP)